MIIIATLVSLTSTKSGSSHIRAPVYCCIGRNWMGFTEELSHLNKKIQMGLNGWLISVFNYVNKLKHKHKVNKQTYLLKNQHRDTFQTRQAERSCASAHINTVNDHSGSVCL